MQKNDFSRLTKVTLLIIVSAACMGSAMLAPLYPALGTYFNLANNQTTSLVSIYLFGYLVGQILHSFLSMKYGYRLSLKIGFIIFIFASLFQLISIYLHWYALFFYSRLFSALGASSGLICAFAIINKMPTRECIPKYISLAFMSLTLSAYLFITVSGIISGIYGFKSIFNILTLIAFIQFLLILKFIPDLPDFHHNDRSFTLISRKYLQSLINPKLILSSIIVAFTTTATYLYNATAASISTNILFFSTQTFGYFSILLLAGLLIGGLLNTYLAKKTSQQRILSSGLFISFLSLFLLLFFSNCILIRHAGFGYMFFILVAFLNLGLGLIYPSASYIALNSIECTTTASSIMNCIKISFPALVIFIVSRTDLSSINSFQIPLLIFLGISLLNSFVIKSIEKKSIA